MVLGWEGVGDIVTNERTYPIILNGNGVLQPHIFPLLIQHGGNHIFQ